MNLANRITLARIALIPLFMLCFLHQQGWMMAMIIFAIAAGTDKLDGYIARKYNQVTRLGKLLDPLADKLLISVALIMMVQENMISSWPVVVIIAREIVITALRMVAAEQGIALAADQYGKIKMVLQVAAILAVLLHHVLFHSFTDIRLDMILLWLATGVTLLSGLNYIIVNYKWLR
ncbi:CDP-diacylglycerol--glycerol-3-phosphate 3-phosphatidyltransferase [Paenibacillus silvae]|uniref:CDP-diacylglycerol--glycerol-3-phosphate 3-phosphatidyltransferase n=1 Tax=Paenibacillus TaxID=44249 RepID=UPI001C10ECBD|nr:CDP-diacylglycerol--glycerol-3-phosphate 3-phosphatidyltransferase [Paenibacillus silvae]MBU5356239.1 CDP-diacylglycerol--glycerol-3-phosphate 3-phosphatidyltransferase [Paenibacillus barcinonensis]MDM5279030.1 CDP-diacylglycerol--glycerol-3-phosphate 3-phosphatidyltransferase [Paenibacillus silvae]